MRPLILASRSPRRRGFLEALGVAFEADAADVDESWRRGESPSSYVRRVAKSKALAVAERRPGSVVLAADTTVVVDGDVLGKPADAPHARAMLRRLAGRSHDVLGAVVLVHDGHMSVREVATVVEFDAISGEALEAYLASGEPFDKAGAYGIQGLGGAFVRHVHGSYSNVVGLPLVETRELLRAARVPSRLDPVAEPAP